MGDASTRFPEFHARYQGCEAALHDAGLAMSSDLQVDAPSTEQAGYDAAKVLLARKQPFDAVFAASDLIAIGAMHALTEAGLRLSLIHI